MAGAKGLEVLDAGYGVTGDDIQQAAKQAGVSVRKGDVALVRTGWAQHFGDTDAYLRHGTGVPGLTESPARWLADNGIVATGADTTAYEQIPAGMGHRTLPVHRVLLVEHGIHIIEHLNLEEAARASLTEFCFVLSPLKILGGTGSPVRPSRWWTHDTRTGASKNRVVKLREPGKDRLAVVAGLSLNDECVSGL